MIEIDGSMGEGGGQVLRTALAMSLVTREPIHVTKIRSGRSDPGIKSQHLAAVKAAQQVGDAEVEGAHLGSKELTFTPRTVITGAFRFEIGTAGSTTLVLQTVMPALLMAPERSQIIIEGGTHNPGAPPWEFFAKAFVPLLNKLGPQVTAKLDRAGFYPEGGGKVRVEISPVKKLTKLEILERGDIKKRRAVACVANLPLHIVERELKVMKHQLGFKQNELRSGDLGPCRVPGNVLYVEIEMEDLTEVVTGIGAKNLRAEQVAEMTAKETKVYLDSGMPVGPYLADQLMLPLALSGGEFRTMLLTKHSLTQLDVLSRFGVKVSAEPKGKGARVEVKKLSLG